MKTTIAVTLLAMLLPVAGMATTVTIDFNSYTTGDPGEVFSQGYTVFGFGFDSRENPSGCCVGGVSGGEYSVYSYSDGPPFYPDAQMQVTVSRTDGSAFSLHAIDRLDDFAGPFAGISGKREADGSSFGGGTLGQGDWLAITEFTVFASASGSPVQIDGAVDNIVVGAAVPIPAAVWLFGSGVLALFGISRQRTASG